MFKHDLRVVHSRTPTLMSMGSAPVESSVDIETGSSDLVKAWMEAIYRMPTDLRDALKTAMEEIDART